MQRVVVWWDRHQVALYVAAIVIGGVFGVLAPSAAPVLSAATNPVLAVLLFATFLGVPLIEVGRSFRDLRFLGTVLAVNFVLSDMLAGGASRSLRTDTQGKTLALAILQMPVDLPADHANMKRPH